MQTLSSEQTAVVESDAPLIVVAASAGSGKTRAVVERIHHLISVGVGPEQIVAICYTNAAANELASRLNIPIAFTGTLHSFLLKLIQQHANKLGFATSRLAVLDEQSADELLARCAADVGCKATMKALRAEVRFQLERGLMSSCTADMLAVKRFFQVTRQHAVVSYDMILSLGLNLLMNHTLDLPYKHLIVDEGQDISRLMAVIIDHLPIPNTVMVGDPDQAVFSWDGGDVACFMSLAKSPAAAVFKLEANYRSDRAICAAAQRLIEHNADRIAKQTVPVSTAEGVVTVREFANPLEEQSFVLTEIMGAITHGNSVAVLVRTNALVDQWATAARAMGIPVASRRRVIRPMDWPAVKAALAVLVDPTNDWACYTLVRLKDGEAQANAIRTHALAAGQTINEQTFHLPLDLAPDAYTSILARIGACDESLALVTKAIEELGPDATGTDLMAHIAAADQAEEEIGTGVTISTIHSSKSREWDVCYLPAFEQEIIPGVAKSRTLDEERRLAYVAFTRARHALHISFCKERRPNYGGWQPLPATPSQFIAEAGIADDSPIERVGEAMEGKGK